jgi:hypothetical protein
MSNLIGSTALFFTFTGEKVVTFDTSDNISKMSILCTTDTLPTLTNSKSASFDGNPNNGITVPKNMPIYLEGVQMSPLDDVVLTIPSGCTVLVIVIR